MKRVLKYLFMSILFGVLYGIINYWTNTVVEIKELILTTFVYFIVLCLIALIGPFLRKLFGYENKDNKSKKSE
jgi:ribose/xylose/arabinose/galactoside ABC-type transport system permease subunit